MNGSRTMFVASAMIVAGVLIAGAHVRPDAEPPEEFEWAGPPDAALTLIELHIRTHYRLTRDLASLNPPFDADQHETRMIPLRQIAGRLRDQRESLDTLSEEEPERYIEVMDEYRSRLELAQKHLHEQLERIALEGAGSLSGRLLHSLYNRHQMPINLRRVYSGATLKREATGLPHLFQFDVDRPGEDTILMLREGFTDGWLFGNTAHPEIQSIYLVLPVNARPGDRFTLSVEEGTLAMRSTRRMGYAVHDPDGEARAEVEILPRPWSNFVARLDISVPVIYDRHYGPDESLRRHETITYRGVYSFTQRPQ